MANNSTNSKNTNIAKFVDAVGSKPDSKENAVINAIDLYENTRFSTSTKDNDGGAFVEGILQKPTPNIVALDIGLYKGKERATLLTLSYSENKDPVSCHIVEETGEKHYDATKKIPEEYIPLGGFETSGKTNSFQRLVFKKPITAKTIRVAFDKNSDGSPWLSVVGMRAVLGKPVEDNNSPPITDVTPVDNNDNNPNDVKDDKPIVLGEPLNTVYPEPKTKDPKPRSIKYDDAIGKKNRGTRLQLKLPLLANKKDKWGECYTDFAKFFSLLGLTFKAPINENGSLSLVPCIKNYNFANEKTEVFENNNSNGESKRFDFHKTFMPMFEITMWLNNRASDKGDEESLKDGGGHHSHDGERQVADCLIVQIKNDGKSACTQLEPSHMDDDPNGYGDKFNKVDLDLPSLIGNSHSLRLIRVNDLPNKRVIIWAAIKFDKIEAWKDWTVVYQTEIYDGMGGNRGLKDPYRQWAGSALGDYDECGITLRMDKQLKQNIKKGQDYNNPRITEIIDYAV
ncbi:MAG: hypothetical protein R2685_07745 [Candidatus Nitrosocosmicus sp.]|nr:hypothetical protein [Candidatus Nitrosocosmicus sp.]